MKKIHSKLIIIGSGPAGYTAGIYASRAMLNPIIIQGIQPGGQLTITTDVENYPGFTNKIQGPWLMDQMENQAKKMGAKIIKDYITHANIKIKPIELIGDSNTKYTCNALIICTGSQAKWLNLPSEKKFQGYGVSACATCDGFFYRNKKVIVVGGGNTAIEEALFLTNFASKVIIIHRRNNFRAEKILINRLEKNSKIKIIWNSIIEEIIGNKNPMNVTDVKIKNIKTNKINILSTDGVFIAIGHTPSTELFKNQLIIKKNGYLSTLPNSTATNIKGVYAAGDVMDDKYRQAITAAGMGCIAALEAEKYLSA